MPDARSSWLRDFTESAPLGALSQSLDTRRSAVVNGSRGSSTHLLAGALASQSPSPLLLVVAHLDEADDAMDDLEWFDTIGCSAQAQSFGALEVLPGESSVNLELLAQRLDVVGQIVAGQQPKVLVASIQALMQNVPKPDTLDTFSLTLNAGATFSPGRLLDWLDQGGYVRQDAIEQPGDFAIRGGIVDLYPPTGGSEGPIRLDYFGDQIESICTIDPDTLGSGPSRPSVRLLGAIGLKAQKPSDTVNLIDLLTPDTWVVLHEVLELSEQARGYYERLTQPQGIASPNTVFHKLHKLPHVEVYSYAIDHDDAPHAITLPVTPMPTFDQDAKSAIAQLADLASDPNHDVQVLCRRPAERDRLCELIRELAPDHAHAIHLEVGLLHRGFIFQDSSPKPQTPSLYLIPHHELFHRYETRRRVRRITTGVATQKNSDAFLDLEVGDPVVHVDHGIARYLGLKIMQRQGVRQEYLTLEFANHVLLHVPATQIELIQKYVGGFHGKPPLSTLGGKRWTKQKDSVSESVRDLAKELIQVQAARQTTPGIRYPADTIWQKKFEAEFPYEETQDQLAAIKAIKRDMSDSPPMDRLICGDVGFGKTEVAIRAAFKVIESGRQVAVLVPTTVLAEQHELTFRGRLADYPFRVASLSRFKTPAEQRKTLLKLAQGNVDIIIGTHRLLSQDVQFANLGMVIIDEEQRFGVEHKNRLLAYRLTADVLTLTATPIPRTLHMSMIGLRDISSLSTAPVDRRAIVTEVIPFDRQRIKRAIHRELNREGQCFFVHNRVHNIQSIANDLQRLVPEARILVGHGQMPPRELEDVMIRFMRHEADILVSTTIIESGIDIPTANTMFINQADHFGLSELHQLRGRVGRYKHRAYCYLLLPENRSINENAIKRLKAIEQYAMLGAGFKISMRDLEIRGSGNLLGPEQSGHIAAVGYEMYCLLLEQQTKRLRHEPIIEPAKTHLELPVTGSLPKRYIPSDKFRMEAYRRLGRATTLSQLQEVERTLTQAYGPPPERAQTLLDLTELRMAASTLGIDSLKLEGADLIFTTSNMASLQPLFRDAPGRVSVIEANTLYYRPPSNYLNPPATLLAVLRKLLVRPIQNA